MELKEIVNEYGIVGVIGNYKNKIEYDGKVKDIKIKDISKALQMVSLDNSYLEKKISDLTISEYFKIELLTKLEDEIIIIGNMSNSLIYKDMEYIKKLLIKLNKDYNKKIIIIDNDIKSFFNCVNNICVTENNRVIYNTNNYYADKLYNYVKMPKIVDFIKYVNKDNKRLNETIEIYELIKDIYRSVS